MTPGPARRRAPAGLLLAAAAFVLAGCGSSSQQAQTTATTGHGTASGWHVASRRTTPGRAVATIGGTFSSPAAIKVEVDSSPRVASQVDYSIDCEPSGTHPVTGVVPPRRTPLTAAIPVPPDAPSCFVAITASKSAPTAMTLTLSVRPA